MINFPTPYAAARITAFLSEHLCWSAFWDKRDGVWRVSEHDPDSDLYAETPDAAPARGLVAIDPRPSCGDRTWDAIDIALARVTSAGELDDRISRITALVPGLNAGRLRQWCQATAVISVVQRRFRYRHDGAVPDEFLLGLAASA